MNELEMRRTALDLAKSKVTAILELIYDGAYTWENEVNRLNEYVKVASFLSKELEEYESLLALYENGGSHEEDK